MGSMDEPKESPLPTLSLKVTEELDRDLADLAKRRSVSKSALIRDALADFVARERASTGAAQAEDVDEYGW